MNNLGGLLPIMADADLRALPAPPMPPRTCARQPSSRCKPGPGSTILNVLEGCGHLCAATGRPADAITAWAAQETLEQQDGFWEPDDSATHRREGALRDAWRVLGPRRARAAEQRGAAMSLATAAEYALMLDHPQPAASPGRTGNGQAQHPGTRAGHPGRPGSHRRADRRSAVHQHPHRPLASGPDPGQDRLPPPRRPDPPGPQRRPGLASPPARHQREALWVIPPQAAAAPQKG